MTESTSAKPKKQTEPVTLVTLNRPGPPPFLTKLQICAGPESGGNMSPATPGRVTKVTHNRPSLPPKLTKSRVGRNLAASAGSVAQTAIRLRCSRKSSMTDMSLATPEPSTLCTHNTRGPAPFLPKEYYARALVATAGNVTKAAFKLRCNKNTFTRPLSADPS
jgi:hypothetical protein